MNSVEQWRIRPGLLVAVADDTDSIVWHGPIPADSEASEVRRIRQPDLRGGIRERAQLRSEWSQAHRDPADLIVAIEIDVLIDASAAAARAELLRLGESQSGDTLRYVGTANGLTTLVLDVYVTEVADAVILRPIDSVNRNPSISAALIVDEVLPALRRRYLKPA
jgi:hypothetical protein